jgi:hypothetical protein
MWFHHIVLQFNPDPDFYLFPEDLWGGFGNQKHPQVVRSKQNMATHFKKLHHLRPHNRRSILWIVDFNVGNTYCTPNKMNKSEQTSNKSNAPHFI